jgi:hypothetical protein
VLLLLRLCCLVLTQVKDLPLKQFKTFSDQQLADLNPSIQKAWCEFAFFCFFLWVRFLGGLAFVGGWTKHFDHQSFVNVAPPRQRCAATPCRCATMLHHHAATPPAKAFRTRLAGRHIKHGWYVTGCMSLHHAFRELRSTFT